MRRRIYQVISGLVFLDRRVTIRGDEIDFPEGALSPIQRIWLESKL